METDVPSLANSDVINKYKTAADICQRSLEKVIAACVDGALVIQLCQLGDDAIEEFSATVYSKGKVPKGIAFPTCISLNNVICHFSPLISDPEAKLTMTTGDLVKIQIGAHVDGYAATTAHSLVVGATAEQPVTGRKTDVIKAAHLAAEAAIRTVKPGNKNSSVTEIIQRITEAFNVKAVEGMLSHQQERNIIDGKKQIVLNPSEQQRSYERCDFEEGEIWAIDVLISSSAEAKPKESEYRTTVFRKTSTTYQLKMKTSRAVLSEVTTKFGLFPFVLRALEDEKRARMGIQECATHQVVSPYPVYVEKEEGEVVAQFLFTVLLTPSGTVRLTPSLYDEAVIKSDKELHDEDLVKLLNAGIGKKKTNKKKKKE